MINASEKLSGDDWDAIARIIQNEKRFLITTHVNADPDALGSELALAEALRKLGKEPIILNPTPISCNHQFLDPANSVKAFKIGEPLEDLKFDAVFILDISRWERLGDLADPIRFCGRPKICMDHHPYSGGFADYHVINTAACATAEIVYDLINILGVSLNQRMAECLYTSMLADTGSFTFSNTNARSHKIVAELLTHNVCPRTICEQLYQNHTPERLKFLGNALSNLQFDCNQKLAWMTISHEMLDRYGLKPEDVEGFVDFPRNCRNVLLSVLFLEVEPDDIKISLRAKGEFNANRLATHFGGGGHVHASGIRLIGELNAVQETILSEARKALEPFLTE
jgi:bifunctional oligoribonuclease and PAP phosphatase NrnA